jgi:hypothetical protein
MARGREGMAKRARERARLERQEAKRIRREARAAENTGPDPDEEARLMEEFRSLSERRAASEISESTYEAERQRLFAELGIEPG